MAQRDSPLVPAGDAADHKFDATFPIQVEGRSKIEHSNWKNSFRSVKSVISNSLSVFEPIVSDQQSSAIP